MDISRLKFGLRFQALSAQERAFLWILRGHVRHLSNTFGPNSAACPKTVLFIDTFRAALSETLIIAPRHCRCAIRLHEDTLIKALRASRTLPAFRQPLADLLPGDAIETLWQHAQHVEAELSDWLLVSGV